MKIPITKRVPVGHVDIDLPFYYVHDLSGHDDYSIVYGKVMEFYTITVHERFSCIPNDMTYEFECSPHSSIENSGLETYLTDPNFASDKEAFDAMYKKMMDFMKSHE